MSQLRESLTNFERLVLWALGVLALAGTLSSMAFLLQQIGIAPAGLLPLITGASLGLGAAVVRGVLLVPSVRVACVAAVLAGLLIVVGQDYIGYRVTLRHQDEAIVGQSGRIANALVELERVRPAFPQYLAQRVRSHPWWWSLEFALTAGVAAWIVHRHGHVRPLAKQPST